MAIKIILLVDDEESIRGLCERVLQHEGYQVLSAASGDEALGLAEDQQDIDLLLTDLGMPGMNGHELAEGFRERCPEAKIVYMSGYPGKFMLDSSLAPPLLEKPFDPDRLVKTIRDVLED